MGGLSVLLGRMDTGEGPVVLILLLDRRCGRLWLRGKGSWRRGASNFTGRPSRVKGGYAVGFADLASLDP
jgi:hypothetical protein